MRVDYASGGPAREETPAPLTGEEIARLEKAMLVLACTGGALLLAWSPRTRRIAWRLTRLLATTWVPAWLAREARDAWHASLPPSAEPGVGIGS